jgi:hypothetical protein
MARRDRCGRSPPPSAIHSYPRHRFCSQICDDMMSFVSNMEMKLGFGKSCLPSRLGVCRSDMWHK